MSGICGVIRLDGAPAPALDGILDRLSRRGPDGRRAWADGPAALGHALLATTPEALREALPLADPASGCVITADARLDNREELAEALALGASAAAIGDGEMILRAWLAWGEGCLDHLLGDWAFAIWDPVARRLFAARDPIGMRQLLYAHLPGRLLAFATEARAVLAAPGVPRRLNERRIADFLDGAEGADLDSTFFEGVLRLPPAHSLTLDLGGLVLRRYWTLRPPPPLRLDGPQAYERAFLDVFTEAVRCRLRGAGPVGSMLSGGMDSGSIVAVASRLLAEEGRGPLRTFSAVGPDPAACVETCAIHAALGLPGLNPTLVDWADLGPWREDLVRLLRELDEPFDGNMNLVRAIYLAARRAGVKVVLDGVGGDVVAFAGGQVAWELRAGRWVAAWRHTKGEAAFFGFDRLWPTLRLELASAFAPVWLRRLRWRWRAWRARGADWTGRLPGLARRADVHRRRDRRHRDGVRRPRSFAEERAASIVAPNLVVGRERYDRVAGALGIEPRDPFLDLRVIRFMLSLPPDQLRGEGWPKMILRRAMQGLLPDAVRWRRGKEHLGWRFTEQLLADPSLMGYGHPNVLADNAGQDAPDLAKDIADEDQLHLGAWLVRNAPSVGDPCQLLELWR